MKTLNFRHEYKHYINYADYFIIRQRLKSVMELDYHVSEEGEYHIRSLYFDNYKDKVFNEKIHGLDSREKFRIRCYNKRYDVIQLEKKSKLHGLCNKQSCKIDAEEVYKIIQNDYDFLIKSGKPLMVELYTKMKSQLIKPKTIVDYIREPFICNSGNVRITIDRDIRTGVNSIDMLNPDLPTVPINDMVIILEVKYDEYLPRIIADIIQLKDRQATSFSKYAACRIYG